jgi:predicted nucleotidyltransferase
MFQKLLRKLAQALDKASIPYMVIGGQAVLLYGEPRLTSGIDITLGTGAEGLEKVKKVLPAANLKGLVEQEAKFVAETMVLPTIEEKSGIRVDFIFSTSRYEQQAIARARKVPMGNVQVKFAALEDVVVHKVIAGRAVDLEDVETMLLKNPECDSSYVERWLVEFDRALGENFLERFRNIQREMR